MDNQPPEGLSQPDPTGESNKFLDRWGKKIGAVSVGVGSGLAYASGALTFSGKIPAAALTGYLSHRVQRTGISLLTRSPR